MIAAILDGGESARLPTELVRKQHIASAADASYGLYQRFDTLFTLMIKHKFETYEPIVTDNCSSKQLLYFHIGLHI